MGIALFVTFDREVPGINSWDVDGKILAHNIDKLDRVARRLNLKPLGDFQSMSIEEYRDLVGADEEPVEPLGPDSKFYEDVREECGPEAADELRALMDGIDGRLNEQLEILRDAGPPEEQWFAPSEGLATVRGLLSFVRERPGKFYRADDLLADLQDVERSLQAAERHGVRFHLSLDM